LNLPGQPNYDPQLSWFSKVQIDDHVAADFFTYVDDIRTLAGSKLECWAVTQWAASLLSYLGLQDAPRKQQGLSWRPGASAGSVAHHARPEGVAALVTEKRWDKTRHVVRELIDEVNGTGAVRHKVLESHGGFLIYVARMYTWMPIYERHLLDIEFMVPRPRHRWLEGLEAGG